MYDNPLGKHIKRQLVKHFVLMPFLRRDFLKNHYLDIENALKLRKLIQKLWIIRSGQEIRRISNRSALRLFPPELCRFLSEFMFDEGESDSEE